MRTKILLGLAVLAVSASTLVAQVYSLNIVGYVNQAVPAGSAAAPSFVLIGNPLKASPDNTVGTVLAGQLPATSSLLSWDGSTFLENVYSGGGAAGWDVPDAVIAPGTGFFIKNPTTTAATITFVGEVLAGLQTNSMTTAFSLVSSKVPVAGDLFADAHLNFTNMVANDSLLTWDGSTYIENVYAGGGAPGWDSPPVVTVGQGFFLKQAGAVHTVNWITIGFP
ncbi:MAG TPA: hypothetical protein VJA21_34125 [Verrucomicrobiae bacterium]